MIDPAWLRQMARYNRWQNASLYEAAASLPADELTRERGAFFGSILATLNHILWADELWLWRLSGGDAQTQPRVRAKDGLTRYGDLAALRPARERADKAIIAWADGEHPRLADDLVWRAAFDGQEWRAPYWVAATHMFNHQTHHRGQVHCLLTQQSAKPDDTDLILMLRRATGE